MGASNITEVEAESLSGLHIKGHRDDPHRHLRVGDMRVLVLLVLVICQELHGSVIHDDLRSKFSFTEESVNRYLEGMTELSKIQRALFKEDEGVRGRPEEDEDEQLSFEQAALRVKSDNPMAIPYLFEGDIMLTEEQLNKQIHNARLQLYEKKGIPVDERMKRTLTSETYLRWTSFPIPFVVTGSVNRGAVLAGIKLWEDNTCITFRENGAGRNSLRFVYGNGCNSYLGMSGGAQQVSIGPGCDWPAIVAHEVGHALGYYHEQARFDRDAVVRILPENIMKGMNGQFTKQRPSMMTTFGVDYDPTSVMHYDAYAFSKNRRPTIQTLDANFINTIGQRVALSFNDVKKMNFAYCNSTCPVKLACRNSGYTDPKNCKQCRCPDGLGGILCDEVLQTSNNCGTIQLTAQERRTTLMRSGVGACNYLIKAQPGQKIYIYIENVRFISSSPCVTDYVELKYSADLGNGGARVCSSSYSKSAITSETDQVLVLYRSQYSSNTFTISYETDDSPPLFPYSTTTTTTAPPTPINCTGTTTTTSAPCPMTTTTMSPRPTTTTPSGPNNCNGTTTTTSAPCPLVTTTSRPYRTTTTSRPYRTTTTRPPNWPSNCFMCCIEHDGQINQTVMLSAMGTFKHKAEKEMLSSMIEYVERFYNVYELERKAQNELVHRLTSELKGKLQTVEEKGPAAVSIEEYDALMR